MIITDTIARDAADHLAIHDSTLMPLIRTNGVCPIRPHGDHYRELVSSIISQQLSLSAARAVENRFVQLFSGKFPATDEILRVTPDQLRSAGLSYRKAAYVQDLAKHIDSGEIDLAAIAQLTNSEIIAKLTNVKGIGEWTVHMFLIFCLGRSDILPVGDLGIKNAIQVNYNIGHRPVPSEIEVIAQTGKWHPYESIAAWYLWRSLDNEPKPPS